MIRESLATPSPRGLQRLHSARDRLLSLDGVPRGEKRLVLEYIREHMDDDFMWGRVLREVYAPTNDREDWASHPVLGYWTIQSLADCHREFPLYEEDLLGHFSEPPDDGEIQLDLEMGEVYYGQRVAWLGSEGKMFRAYPRFTWPMQENIFEQEKICAIGMAILGASEEKPIYIPAPYGDMGQIDINDIREDQQNRINMLHEHEVLDHRYWTTGDDELDNYLGDPEEFLSTWDEDDAVELRSAMEERVQEAIQDQDGDIGEMWVQIRNGNHRTFAAFLAGEPFVWVRLEANRYQEVELPDNDWSRERAPWMRERLHNPRKRRFHYG